MFYQCFHILSFQRSAISYQLCVLKDVADGGFILIGFLSPAVSNQLSVLKDSADNGFVVI